MRFDQLQEGAVYRTPTISVTLNDMVAFATEWDPQYLHIDADKASQGPFQGIIASGMHTVALVMRLWVAQDIWGDDVLAGVQLNAQFVKPLYPDDQLRTEIRVMHLRPHPRRPERGYCDIRIDAFTERNCAVLQLNVTTLIRR